VTIVFPGWLENAGAVHTAAQMRSYIGGLLAGTNAAATDLVPRGGVNPYLGGEMLVQSQPSPNMSVRISSGLAGVPGGESATQGAYWVLNDAEVTVPITAAHGSLPRIDSIIVRVRDSDYSGANDDALFEVVAGTPASSPVAPALFGNRVKLADITVGAGVTSITSGNISDARSFLRGLGGTRQVRSQSELNSIGTTQVIPGDTAWARQEGTLHVFDITNVWRQIPFGPAGDVGRVYVSKTGDTARNTSTGSAYSDDPHLQANGLPANATYKVDINLIVSAVAVGQGDIAMRFTHPGSGGAYLAITKHGLFHAAATAVAIEFDGEATARTTVSPTPELSAGCGATPSGILFRGKLFTGSNGGDFRLQWKLLLLSGTTTLRQESDMYLERIS
jgi:hypothetical protein